jgi:hypothetical protein
MSISLFEEDISVRVIEINYLEYKFNNLYETFRSIVSYRFNFISYMTIT